MRAEKNGIRLSEEQQLFVSKALDGHNILVDACVGSGKTTAIQALCNTMPPERRILYLTYNRLLKIDAKSRIRADHVTVTNYHGFAYASLRKAGISAGVPDLIQTFNKVHPHIPQYDMLILDEYQDIELELAEMLKCIKASCPGIQVIAVGDMDQKIYDKTTLDVPSFLDDFLGDHIRLAFTKCFRLSPVLAEKLGRIWGKTVIGANENCIVEEMNITQAIDFLAQQRPQDILCLGPRNGGMADALNALEFRDPDRFNKETVYASIQETDTGGAAEPKKTSAVFTTYDSSKGLERPVCVVFDYTERYWQARLAKPQQSYPILRNIFCVAASRGKQHIIFVKNGDAILSEQTIAAPAGKNTEFEDVNISQMFDFRYKEDVEECYDLLHISPVVLSEDRREIKIRTNDGLIDLSPCIGIYQEAAYFCRYDIDREIDFWLAFHHRQRTKADGNLHGASLDQKILSLTALETKQDRYLTQVDVPFVSDAQRALLCQRLSARFSEEETVQVECAIPFADQDGEKLLFTAKGRADVVKDHIVYELKFVSELTHEHFLQCACYMAALELDVGILWNTRKNQAYEIRVPDRRAFLDAVAKTVTKGFLKQHQSVGAQAAPETSAQETVFAVIDTETNFHNEVMSIGVVIADAVSYQTIDSKYYIISPECSVGGMYAGALHLAGRAQLKECSRAAALADLQNVLNTYGIRSICAYNASFDRNHLPELQTFMWYDIMKLAAYRQYNRTISDNMNCTANGKLKSGYGVEPTLRRLSGDFHYHETHHALLDARDELKIMQLLGQPFGIYRKAAAVHAKPKTARTGRNSCKTNPAPAPARPGQDNRKAKAAPAPARGAGSVKAAGTADRTCWCMDELTYRYQVSRYKISSDLIPRGLPYDKEGRAYRFPMDAVKRWEIQTKRIPYGRGGNMIELPAYLEYRESLLDELAKAKRNQDKPRIQEIRALAKQNEIPLHDRRFPAWLPFVILAACALAACWIFR